MKNVIFMGIDQTGAVDGKGKPRPLPACQIKGATISFFYLDELSRQEIMKKNPVPLGSKLFICVDCVFGLPESIDRSWPVTLKMIKKTTAFGRKPASNFFKILGQGSVPRRKIELLCNANSVFQEKPFQKNIQTGTFRIWKDISANPNDFHIPALLANDSKDKIPLYEGYPSLSWRLLLNCSRRAPQELTSLVKSYWPKLIWSSQHQSCVDQDPNFADAFLLALTMKVYLNDAISLRPSKEGWILGFTYHQ